MNKNTIDELKEVSLGSDQTVLSVNMSYGVVNVQSTIADQVIKNTLTGSVSNSVLVGGSISSVASVDLSGVTFAANLNNNSYNSVKWIPQTQQHKQAIKIHKFITSHPQLQKTMTYHQLNALAKLEQ